MQTNKYKKIRKEKDKKKERKSKYSKDKNVDQTNGVFGVPMSQLSDVKCIKV